MLCGHILKVVCRTLDASRCMSCCTWRHLQTTRLQPPFFSTGFPHLGQGLVLAASQLLVSLASWIFCFHLAHLHACAPLCPFTHMTERLQHTGFSHGAYVMHVTILQITFIAAWMATEARDFNDGKRPPVLPVLISTLRRYLA